MKYKGVGARPTLSLNFASQLRTLCATGGVTVQLIETNENRTIRKVIVCAPISFAYLIEFRSPNQSTSGISFDILSGLNTELFSRII